MHIFKWNVQKSAIKVNDWSANCQKPRLMDSVTDVISIDNSFKCTQSAQVILKANKVYKVYTQLRNKLLCQLFRAE